MTTDIVKFNFNGDDLDCVKDGQDLWVSVRRMCGAIGIDSKNQREKLQNKSWARGVFITSRDVKGRNQEQFFLHIDSVPMWLATIDERKVAAAVKPKVIKFQLEAAKALRDHFLRSPVPKDFAEALQLAADTERARVAAIALNEANRPKVEFAEGIKNAVNSVTISEFAKSLANGGIPFGEKLLFKWLRMQGYLCATSAHYNKPFQNFIDRGYFKVDPRTRWNKTKQGNEIYYVTLITGVGQTVLEKKIRENPDTWSDILKRKLKTGKRARVANTATYGSAIQ
jgi:phage antirepressor YoqD-like protein